MDQYSTIFSSPALVYRVHDSVQQIAWTDAIVSQSLSSCGPLTYTFTSSGLPLDPNVFTVPVSKRILVETSDELQAGTHNIQLDVTYTNWSNPKGTKHFTIEVINCDNLPFNPNGALTETYLLGDPLQETRALDFTSDSNYLSCLEYEDPDYTPMVPDVSTVSTFDPSTRKFSLSGTDLSLAGTYTVSLVVNIWGSGDHLTTYSWTLILLEHCSTSTVTLDAAKTIFLNPAMTYYVNQPSESITWADTDVTEEFADCGQLSY